MFDKIVCVGIECYFLMNNLSDNIVLNVPLIHLITVNSCERPFMTDSSTKRQ